MEIRGETTRGETTRGKRLGGETSCDPMKHLQNAFPDIELGIRIDFVCLGLTSLSTLSVIPRRCLVVTGSSMLTFIVLPYCDTFT